MADAPSSLTPLQQALLSLERMQRRLDATREPVAIVGMACRLPGGANDPDAFWTLLDSGIDAIVVEHDASLHPCGRKLCIGVRLAGSLEFTTGGNHHAPTG